MKIAGMQRFTLTDYPGELACVLFLWGCNMRCPWCHNPDLVINNPDYEMSVEKVMAFLDAHKGRLTGVVISGGEPTLDKDGLVALCEQIKERGYKIKLDTNGSNFPCINLLVNNELIDFIGLDFKCTEFEYKWLAQHQLDVFFSVDSTFDFLQAAEFPYEVRTTVVNGYFGWKEMEAMYKYLVKRGVKRWILQPFRKPPQGVLDKSLVSGYIDKTLLGDWRDLIYSLIPEAKRPCVIDLESRYS